jgi:opacity protein-like surface antigen
MKFQQFAVFKNIQPKPIKMKVLRFLLMIAFVQLLTLSAKAQDELLSLFEDEKEVTDYAYATFKTTRLVYGQSVENPAEGNLLFLIQHNFGALNSGFYELFGLDRATIRLGLEYGINDFIMIGAGRSTWEKTYDGFVKVKLLRQSSGARNMPVSVSYIAASSVSTLRWRNPDRENYFSSRVSYLHQILIARKFSSDFSLQLSPTIIHKNLVPTRSDENTSYALGVGGRYKLSQRISLNAEYFYYPEKQTTIDRTDVLSIGIDIETGGHVFQLHISNGNAMYERAFITETQGKWNKGDIFFGFNISRNFVLKKPEEFRK